MEQTQAPAKPIAYDAATISDDFLGVVVVDQAITGKFGDQLHIAIRPVRYNLGGKTGAYPMYIAIGENKTGSRSKLGIFMAGMLNVFGATRFRQLGAGEMVGLVAWWKRTEATFGRDRQTGEMIKSDIMLPVREADASEASEAQSAASNWATEVREGQDQGQILVAQNGTGHTSGAPDLTDEQIQAVVRVVVGETDATVIAKAARSRLAPELKASILNGTLLPYLLNAGKLSQKADGTYEEVVEEEAGVAEGDPE